MVKDKKILLVVSGGIAAYKCLELIRLLRTQDVGVRCVLTGGGSKFVTPLSLETLTGEKVYRDLYSLSADSTMGHIEFSRDADLVLVAPASANIIAKTCAGIADDLATTTLLATDKPILMAPAMNVKMWENQATQSNINKLRERGVLILGPDEGVMACNEYGLGRMSEPDFIGNSVINFLKHPETRVNLRPGDQSKLLNGKKILVTSGPTHEALDPVRYIANSSSGRQGHAIATALAAYGAETILVSGPTNQPDPSGVEVKKVVSAVEMLKACELVLPVDVAICAAAVCDWRVSEPSAQKIKKNGVCPNLTLEENPDILAIISQSEKKRPPLVIGFAAETKSILTAAKKKRKAKGCDWIVANDVSKNANVFDSVDNTVHIIDENGIENWPKMSKLDVGKKLAGRIANFIN